MVYRVYTKSRLFQAQRFHLPFLLGGGGSVYSKCQLGSINLYNLSLLIYYACVCVCVYVSMLPVSMCVY